MIGYQILELTSAEKIDMEKCGYLIVREDVTATPGNRAILGGIVPVDKVTADAIYTEPINYQIFLHWYYAI